MDSDGFLLIKVSQILLKCWWRDLHRDLQIPSLSYRDPHLCLNSRIEQDKPSGNYRLSGSFILFSDRCLPGFHQLQLPHSAVVVFLSSPKHPNQLINLIFFQEPSHGLGSGFYRIWGVHQHHALNWKYRSETICFLKLWTCQKIWSLQDNKPKKRCITIDKFFWYTLICWLKTNLACIEK